MGPGPLVTARELADLLASAAPPALLDARWQLGSDAGHAAYLAGHLPGAVHVDLDADLSAPPGPGGRHPLPEPAAFEVAMRRAGVRDDRPVVAYDDGPAGGAARAWWLLTWAGHPAARVLDGGWRGWAAAGLPLTTSVPDPPRGDFTVRPGSRPLLDAAAARELATRGLLLDARVAARYAGAEEPIDPVAGHIPGARSLPAAELYGAGGELLPAAELRERFARAGVRAGTTAGAYCGSGVVAAQVVLALEAAGLQGALYVGSWSEWLTDPARPVATAPLPGATPGGQATGPRPLRLVRAAELRGDTAQTGGMRRAAAISGATVGSGAIWMGQTHVAPATRSAAHHHGASETAIYVVSGHPAFAFLDGGAEVRLQAGPGDYVFVPPFTPHREENPSAGEEAVVVIARTTQEAIVVNLDGLDG